MLAIGEATVLRITHDHLKCVQDGSCIFSALSRRQHEQFNGDPDASRIVICGKTRLHHWDLETKRESIQWKHKGSQTSNKFETQPSAGKIMATMFWDSVGVLLIGYLEHRKNREIYISKLLMDLRHEEIKRPGKLSNGVLLLMTMLQFTLRDEKMKDRCNVKTSHKTFKEGEMVWLHNPQRKKGLSPELQYQWEGPYKIIKCLNDVIFRIQKTPMSKPKVVHCNRLAPFRGTVPVQWTVRDDQS
ncbi:hypothetical protein LAZ67_5003238 [Cordylochernes scorpioides]|uniref:Integrase p58-like C-terminal domain-containing protein n=1 Tax=Cordylochernes scorpioides TaxID=51811 RepID=A0ABY6KI71_9ARAC|nr:hypothetical protein LAZ67_5003238 [Cordylochernes scorpioides]